METIKIVCIFTLSVIMVLADDGQDPTGGVSEQKKLKIVDLYKAPSCPMETQEHDKIHWHYKGMLLNGHIFDQGEFNARLGHRDVITGVDKGMKGLCVGDKRRMTIHSDWAYGDRGVPGTIPPKSILIFDVELLTIERPGVGKVTKDDVMQGSAAENDGGVSKDNKLKVEDTHKTDAEQCTLQSQEHDTVHWKYKGYFLDGKEFDKGEFTAKLGSGDVIKGVDEGMKGLCVGDKRKMTIHSDWGYGDKGIEGTIPPKSTLVFDVELLKIERPDGSVADIQDLTEGAPVHEGLPEGENLKLDFIDRVENERCLFESREGDTVHWNYRGFFLDGEEFDSGEYTAKLGSGAVIKGVDEGMKGLCVGDKLNMTISPEWGYGEEGIPGTIPPNATLIFDVELLTIETPEGGKADIKNIHPALPEGENLKLEDLHKGEAERCTLESKDGDIIQWNYKGFLLNGKEFDSGDFTATLGAEEVIKGVDEGMKGLCVGDKRRMTMSSEWGYGEEGTEGIPGNATLVFDVELVSIERPNGYRAHIDDLKDKTIDPETGLPENDKLKIEITHTIPEAECEQRAQEDDTIHWEYKGTFLDGKEFHSGTFYATLGHGQVIVGVDKGMRGMCVGEKRRLKIHSDWAYGDTGRPGSIPPKATLVFDVHMTKIDRPKQEL